MRKNNQKLLNFYRGIVVKCPNPSCGCYLVSASKKRLSGNAKMIQVFKCQLCGYYFSETKLIIKEQGHIASIRVKLHRAISRQRRYETEVKNLSNLLRIAEEFPKQYRKIVRQGEVILAQ